MRTPLLLTSGHAPQTPPLLTSGHAVDSALRDSPGPRQAAITVPLRLPRVVGASRRHRVGEVGSRWDQMWVRGAAICPSDPSRPHKVAPPPDRTGYETSGTGRRGDSSPDRLDQMHS